MRQTKQPIRSAYAIFTQTICEDLIPAWYGDGDYPVIYTTEREAQLEIADDLRISLEQFVKGEREFDDAISVEDFILAVDVWPDGSISIEDGRIFGKRS